MLKAISGHQLQMMADPTVGRPFAAIRSLRDNGLQAPLMIE
jgi:hypothetical protein